MPEFYFTAAEQTIPVRIEGSGLDYWVQIGEKRYLVRAILRDDGELDLVIDGKQVRAHVVPGQGQQRSERRVWMDGRVWTLAISNGKRRRGQNSTGGSDGILTAPMPGQVREIRVAQGDEVVAGASLLILEAMKMEIQVTAPVGGTVDRLDCAVGDIVERGQMLVVIGS